MMPSNVSYLPAKVFVFKDKAISDKKVLAKLSLKIDGKREKAWLKVCEEEEVSEATNITRTREPTLWE